VEKKILVSAPKKKTQHSTGNRRIISLTKSRGEKINELLQYNFI